jgi:hypothetical protein
MGTNPKFRHIRRSFFALLMLFSISAAAQLPAILEEKDVLPYLEKVIAWHRQAAALEISPDLPQELIFKNSLQQHTAKTLSAAFAYAQGIAAILPPPPPPAAEAEDKDSNASRGRGINRAIAQAKLNLELLQTNLDHAKTKSQRDKFTGQMKLEQEHLNLLDDIAETIGARNAESDTLAQKIQQMEATVPEIVEQPKPPAQEAAAKPEHAELSSSGGIMGLAIRLYGLIEAKSAVKSMLNDTRTFSDQNRERSQSIRDLVRAIMQQGNAIGIAPAPAKAPANAKTKPAAAPQLTYDQLLTDMKKLSKVALALSQMNAGLSNCTRDLSAWVSMISLHIKELMTDLITRAIFMSIAITIAVGIAMLAKQATRRYVLDGRRKNQLRMLRKAILAVTVGMIVFLGVFTDLSSLATFAGLLTAGLAFAMKDMILSVIAYFQFFSAGGIRTGDYVTMANVTGKVTQIGMLRFYVMETEKSEMGFLPTGRVVGFSNAALFQPTPFFRQVPGADFVWSEINIILSPTTDHDAAYKKLSEVVTKTYEKHRSVMQRHEQAMQRLTNFKLSISIPQTYLKTTATGLTFIVRYAVERHQEVALHLQMMEAIITLIKKDPDIKAVHIA